MLSARMLGLTVVRVSAGEELVKCPFHQDSHSSAWFNPHKGLFWCAVCNKGLTVGRLIEEMGSDIDLIELLEETEGEIPDLDLIIRNELLPFGNPLLRPDYYDERGINESVIQKYELEYNVAMKSIVFPVWNIWSDRIGTVQRFIDPEAAGTRYQKNGTMTPVWPLNRLCEFKQNDFIIVTEGVWSALRLASWGERRFTFTLFGAKANQEIVDVLRPFRPIFLYDNDTAGSNACAKMRKLLHKGYAFTLPKAPDDMSADEIAELLRKIRRAVE